MRVELINDKNGEQFIVFFSNDVDMSAWREIGKMKRIILEYNSERVYKENKEWITGTRFKIVDKELNNNGQDNKNTKC
jgi:tRNA threonylcarbamoyladenosine modification (KEOPS) complex Cgi121 subunit